MSLNVPERGELAYIIGTNRWDRDGKSMSLFASEAAQSDAAKIAEKTPRDDETAADAAMYKGV